MFLGQPHWDETTIGEIMSMKQFEHLTKQSAKGFQSSLLEFPPQWLKRKSMKLDSFRDFMNIVDEGKSFLAKEKGNHYSMTA